MTETEKNGLQLLADKNSINQILGVYSLRSLGWSFSAIASWWSKYIFNHIDYHYENRVGIEFGREDFYFQITEEYSDDVYDKGGSYIDENGKTRYRNTEGGWKVKCRYTIDETNYSYDIGAMRYGFHPLIIKTHFTKFLKEYYKKSKS